MRCSALQVTASHEVLYGVLPDDFPVADKSENDLIVRNVERQQIHTRPFDGDRRAIIDHIEVT